MAIAATVLTSGRDSTDLTAYTTAAVTPSSANNLVLVTVQNAKGSTADTPTISGGGLSAWVQIDTIQANNRRITVFRGMGTPGAAAAITIDFGGLTQTACGWSVVEFSGVDTTGTSGSGAVVQSNRNSGSTIAPSATVSLAAFGAAGNATYGAFGHDAAEGTTPGGAFTELTDGNGGSPNTALQTEWANSNQTTVDASWATTGANWRAVALEIKASTGGGTQTVTAQGIVRTPVIGTPTVGVVVLASQLAASRDGTDLSSYTTAPVTPTANALVLLTVLNTRTSATPDAPSVSGGGVSGWAQRTTVVRGVMRLTVFSAMTATPGAAAAITISFPAAQTSCAWSVDQFTGVDTGGADGAGAIVQITPNSGPSATGGSVPLAAFSSTNNVTFGAFAHQANESTPPSSGYNQLTDQHGTSPAGALMVEWTPDDHTSVDATWSTPTSWVGAAAELKAALTVTSQTITANGIVRTPTIGQATVIQEGRIVPSGIVRTPVVGEPTVIKVGSGLTIKPIGIPRRTTPQRATVGSPVVPSNLPAAPAWAFNTAYPAGSIVDYDGRIWQASTYVPKGVVPAGAGDGSPVERSRLLAYRHGYAKDVTGGNAGSTVYVATTAASGLGSLKAALEASGAAWIVFDPALGNDILIDLTSTQINPKPNKTVDGRGRRVRIKGGNIYYRGDQQGPVANLIYSYLEFLEVVPTSTQSLNFGANGNGNTHGGSDLVWVHHCAFSDNRDTMLSGGFFGENESRFTIDWCLFGANPGAVMYTRRPTGGGSDWDTGKAANFGFDKTLAEHGVDGDELTPGYGKITWSYNWFKNCCVRQPKGAGTWHHLYNNLWTEWGLPDGTASVCIEPDTNSEFLVENNVFRPYSNGDRHWFSDYTNDGTVVSVAVADKDAIKKSSASIKLKASNNLLLNGAVKDADVNAGAIFAPTYGYTTLDDISDLYFPVDEVETIVSAGAGNFQPWRDLGPTTATASLLNQKIL